MSKVLPVLLCGGSGTRLWPLSREAYPKQFLSLAGKDSLLQSTCLRLRGLPGAMAPLLISNEEHRFMVAEQCRQVDIEPQAIILEPVGRNTAAAIAVAALHAMEAQQDPVLLVLPSDHLLQDEAGFREAALLALPAAEDGALLTFGIVPTAPETGFGYIKAVPGEGVRGVEQFVEKPDLATAEKYVASGEYFWNSGMFVMRASRWLAALGYFRADIADATVRYNRNLMLRSHKRCIIDCRRLRAPASHRILRDAD